MALGGLCEALEGTSGALAALEAPGVSGRVSLHKVAPFCSPFAKGLFLFIFQDVLEGTTHQVPHMATFGDHWLGGGVA